MALGTGQAGAPPAASGLSPSPRASRYPPEVSVSLRPLSAPSFVSHSPPGHREEPYLTEAGRDAFDRFCRLRHRELQVLGGGLLQAPQLVVVKECELVKDVLNVLIGVASATFSLCQVSQRWRAGTARAPLGSPPSAGHCAGQRGAQCSKWAAGCQPQRWAGGGRRRLPGKLAPRPAWRTWPWSSRFSSRKYLFMNVLLELDGSERFIAIGGARFPDRPREAPSGPHSLPCAWRGAHSAPGAPACRKAARGPDTVAGFTQRRGFSPGGGWDWAPPEQQRPFLHRLPLTKRTSVFRSPKPFLRALRPPLGAAAASPALQRRHRVAVLQLVLSARPGGCPGDTRSR